MPLKPTHKKALIEILTSDEFESPETMVKALVDELDELRSHDVQYIVVCEYVGPAYIGYGPFATRAQSVKAVEAGRCGLPGYGKKAIVPTYSQQHVARRYKSLDEMPDTRDGRIKEIVGRRRGFK